MSGGGFIRGALTLASNLTSISQMPPSKCALATISGSNEAWQRRRGENKEDQLWPTAAMQLSQWITVVPQGAPRGGCTSVLSMKCLLSSAALSAVAIVCVYAEEFRATAAQGGAIRSKGVACPGHATGCMKHFWIVRNTGENVMLGLNGLLGNEGKSENPYSFID